RLASADVNGFAQGSTCNTPPPPPPPPPPSTREWAAELIDRNAPATLAPGAEAEVWVDFKNTGTATWKPGSTKLGTDHPRDRASALAAADWLAANRPATVEKITAPGEVGRFRFHIAAPRDAQGRALSESFALVEEGVAWFAAGAELTLDLEVAPFTVERASAIAPRSASAAGCDLGGRSSSSPLGLALAIAALVLLRRAYRPRR